MTNIEFSTEFDISLNNSTLATGMLRLDEYEKSVFLTKAQENLVLTIYSGQNPTGDSFEATELARAALKGVIQTVTALPVTTVNSTEELWDDDFKHSYWTLPTNNLWFITMEQASQLDVCLDDCFNGKSVKVVVIPQDKYSILLENPFKGPSEKRIFRLDYGTPINEVDNAILELVSKYTVDSYRVRYVRRPRPIILQDLPIGLSINNVTTLTECELGSTVHRKILEDAVQMALATKSLGMQGPSKK